MPVDLSRLNVSLANSKTQKDNNALYQTIKGLIDNLSALQGTVTASNASGGGGGGGGGTDTFNAAFIASLLINNKGINNIPDTGGSSSSSSGFEKELFLGGM